MTQAPRKLFMFCTIALLCACSRRSDVLSREKMSAVMADMVVAEEYGHVKATKDSSLSEQTETLKLYALVFRMHNTSREEFQKSFDYYLSKPEIARAMFDSLSVRVRRDFTQVPTTNYKTE